MAMIVGATFLVITTMVILLFQTFGRAAKSVAKNVAKSKIRKKISNFGELLR